MRWVLGHSQGISPEVERVVVVAGHFEPVAAITGPTEGECGDAVYQLIVSYYSRVGCILGMYSNMTDSAVDRVVGELLLDDLFT